MNPSDVKELYPDGNWQAVARSWELRAEAAEQEVRDLRAKVEFTEARYGPIESWRAESETNRQAWLKAEAHLEAQTAALRALAAEMREQAEALRREVEAQPYSQVERRIYCDGKAMALRYAADKLDALTNQEKG